MAKIKQRNKVAQLYTETMKINAYLADSFTSANGVTQPSETLKNRKTGDNVGEQITIKSMIKHNELFSPKLILKDTY